MQRMSVLEYLEYKKERKKMGVARIEFDVRCLERDLIIEVEAAAEDEAKTIMLQAYDDWCEDDDGYCCEEYILIKLSEAGIEYREIEQSDEEW